MADKKKSDSINKRLREVNGSVTVITGTESESAKAMNGWIRKGAKKGTKSEPVEVESVNGNEAMNSFIRNDASKKRKAG